MSSPFSSLPPVEWRSPGTDYPAASIDIGMDTDLPPRHQQDQLCYAAAQAYLAQIIPDVRVEPVANIGTTAIVMHDSRYAYKVFREQSRDYRRVENETAALQVMGSEGVAPRPVALIDALPQERYASWTGRTPLPLFDGKVLIPSIQGSGHLPVIVTELRDLAPITEIPKDLLVPEFRRIAAAVLKHGLLIADGEFMYDRVANQAIVADLGEAYQPFGQGVEDRPDQQISEAILVRDTFVRFCPPYSRTPTTEDIASNLAAGGIESLDDMLFEYTKLPWDVRAEKSNSVR